MTNRPHDDKQAWDHGISSWHEQERQSTTTSVFLLSAIVAIVGMAMFCGLAYLIYLAFRFTGVL